jgi:hypothetical protein
MKREWLNRKNFIYIVTILLPAIMAGMIAFLYATKWDIHITTLLVWNDEAAYYAQVKMLLQHGFSDGYWGFNGGHALVGTGGAWSAAILLPYVLFGKLFGWTYTSVSIANVVYLCIANALFLLLVKAKKETCIRFAFVELFSLHLWLYLNTQMSEVLRYAMAIVLAGMLYRLFAEEKTSLLYKVIVGVYLLYLMQAYIFFSFAVMIYVYALMRESKKNFWVKGIIGFFAMAFTAGGSYYVLHLISSNYNIFKTERLLNSLKNHDLFGAIKSFLWMAKVGLYDLYTCMVSRTGFGLFHYFVILVIVFCFTPIVLCILQRSKAIDKDKRIIAIMAYAMIIYTGMYVTVYSLEAFTFFRGMGIPLLFVLTLACNMDDYKTYSLFVISFAVLLFFLPANLKAFNEERYVLPEKVTEWNVLQNNFTSAMNVATRGEGEDQDAQRWENTVILYTMEPRVIASLPAGFGQNYMMYQDVLPTTKAGYLLFSLKETGLRGDWLEQSYFDVYDKNRAEIEENYFIQYTDGEYVLYKHK